MFAIFTATESSGSTARFSKGTDNFVTWTIEDGKVLFQVTAKIASGEWFAVGLSLDKRMANTDVLHIGIDPASSQPVFSDR